MCFELAEVEDSFFHDAESSSQIYTLTHSKRFITVKNDRSCYYTIPIIDIFEFLKQNLLTIEKVEILIEKLNVN